MASRDELWTWIQGPVQDVKRAHRDRPELAWDELERTLLERAGLREPTDHPVTRELSERVAAMSDGDRERLPGGDELDALVQEIVGHHADPDPARVAEQAGAAGSVAQPQADYREWYAYLAENGPRWDGDEQSWAGFRAWFRYHAEAAGVGDPAEAFLAEAERSDRHAVFARNHVAVPRPAPTAAAAAAAAQVPGGLDPADVTQVVSQLEQRVVDPVLTRLTSTSPELAALGDDELRVMIGAALAQEIGARVGAFDDAGSR